jgi:hypothetical protein
MAIWRIPSLGDLGGGLWAPTQTCGQMAGTSTRIGRALSLLIGMVLLGSIAQFNNMQADAQTSLLDDGAPTAHTGAPPFEVRVGGQGTETDKQEKDASPRRIADDATPTPANPLWRLPLAQLSTTQERPIFLPSRRPPPPAPTSVAPVAVKQPPKSREPERPAIALAGTIIGTDGYRGAVFRDTSSPDVLRLRVGEDYHGWVLLLVTPREARLVKNGEQVLLELPVPAGTPPRAHSSQEIALEQIRAVGAE